MYFLGEKEWRIIVIVGGIIVILIAFFLGFFLGNNIAISIKEKIIDVDEEIEITSSVSQEISETKGIKKIEEETTFKNEANISLKENKTSRNYTELANELSKKVIRYKNFTLSTSFKEESFVLEKGNKKLNMNETIGDVFRNLIESDNLEIFLKSASGTIKNSLQTINVSKDLKLTIFSNNNYLDGKESEGFELLDKDLILNYEIVFDSLTSWEDLIGENLFILGREYKIIESDYNSKEISILEYPIEFILDENEIVKLMTSFGNNTISILFIDENRVILDINGKRTKTLSDGQIYNDDNFWIKINDILYSKKTGTGGVHLTVSLKKLILNEIEFEYNSTDIDEISIEFVSESINSIEKIIISWRLEEKDFLTNNKSLVMPFFETLKLSLGNKIIDDDEDYWKVYLVAKNYFFDWK